MKPQKYLVAALLACTGIAHAPAATPAASTQTGRVIVRFKADADSVKAKRMDVRMGRYQVGDIAESRAHALGLRRSLGNGVHGGRALDERTQVVTATGMDSATLARQLAKDAEVEFVTVDQRRRIAGTVPPNDTYYADGQAVTSNIPASGQWYLRTPYLDSSTGLSVVSSINAPTAWNVTFGSSSVVVAVIDTGVRFDHPDFTNTDGSSQFIKTTDTTDFTAGYVGYDFIGYGEAGTTSSANAIATANDGNGADGDPSDPGDWVSQADINAGTLGSGCTSSDIGNSSWHGTHVSSLIAAATNNNVGMAGVAGGVKLLPVRVLGKCGGYDSDIMAGMLWSAGIAVPGIPTNPNPAKVLNMSLGGDGACTGTGSGTYPGTIASVTAAGATIVVAAGNSEGEAVGVPGNCPGVITVAALRQAGTKVGFSSVSGAASASVNPVTIAAPGGNCVNVDANGNATGPCLYPILAAGNSGVTVPVPNNNYYDEGFGTSYSTPLVTGTVALMLSERPQLTPAQIKTLLTNTVRAFPTTGGSTGIAACHTGTTAKQDECYCTTSTCGAGMLDTGNAVLAAQALATASASIGVSPASPKVGQTVTLTANTSLASGRTPSTYAWTLVSGGGAVTGFSSGTNASTATLMPTAGGTISVQLTVTDDFGDSYSTTQSISVAALVTGTATISVSPSSPTVGQAITLTGSATLGTGRSVASYAWTLVSGGGAVTGFSSGTSSSTATMSPTAAGTISVQLVITDDIGDTYTGTQSIVVEASSSSGGSGSGSSGSGSGSSGSSSGSSGGGGGGGGAFSPLWAMALMLAALVLRPPRRMLARVQRRPGQER